MEFYSTNGGILLVTNCKPFPQAYTYKMRILIQVLPVPNASTKSANACIHYAKSFCYLLMHEERIKEFGKMNICITRFGIRTGDRKYLNEYTPFGSVSLCFAATMFERILTYMYRKRYWWSSQRGNTQKCSPYGGLTCLVL